MEVRQRTTLSDQMAVSNSSNLRDLLKVREENERRETLTLGSIIGCSDSEKREIAAAAAAASRTLLDIIRDEEGSTDPYRSIICSSSSGGDSGTSSSNNNNRNSWKFFRDRLPLRRTTAAAWISSPPSIDSIPAGSTAEMTAPSNAASAQSGSPAAARIDLAAALAAERQQQLQQREAGVAPVRVSLMALLEQTDAQTVVDGEGLKEVEGEEDGGKEREERGSGEYLCCVCMIRQKGAAFIPCGHTFCRLCSRELWVSRGNCPLCNSTILEILDIF